MGNFRRPIFSEDASPNAVAEVSAAAKKWTRPKYGNDAPLEKPKKEIPFAEGSTLQIVNPIGDNIDTGIAIGPKTSQFLAGSGKRFSDIADRAKQLLPGHSAQAGIDEKRVLDQPLMETTPAMFGYAAPDVIGMSPAPLSKLGYLGSALLGAGEGLLSPTTSREGAGAELLNAGMGFAGGGVGKAVGNVVMGGLGKLANASSGLIPDVVRNFASDHGVQLPKPTWSDSEAQRLYNLMNQHNIPRTIGDLDRHSAWRGGEDMLADFPLSGRRKVLKDQQAGVVQNVIDLQQIGGDLTGNEGAEYADSVRRAFDNAKAASGNNFRLISNIAENDPNITKITLQDSASKLQDILKNSPGLLEEFRSKPFMSKLFGLDRDLGQQNGLIINPKNMKPFQWDQELTFPEAQYVRKQLGGWVSKLRDQKAAGNLPQGVSGEDVHNAASVFNSFENDLDNWATKPENAALSDLWKNARDFHKENVIPYTNPGSLESKSPVFRDIVGTRPDNNVFRIDEQTIPDKLVTPRANSVASDAVDLADAPGQAALKRILMNKITAPAISDNLESGLSTSQLLNKSSALELPEQAILSPSELQQLSNSRDIAMAGGRSSMSGASAPKNGMRTVPWLVGGGAGLGGVTYMASNYLDPDTPQSNRVAAAIAAPALAVLAAKGLNRYTSSNVGQNIHFLDPNLGGALGDLQRMITGGAVGAGESAEDMYRHFQLGNRPTPE